MERRAAMWEMCMSMDMCMCLHAQTPHGFL